MKLVYGKYAVDEKLTFSKTKIAADSWHWQLIECRCRPGGGLLFLFSSLRGARCVRRMSSRHAVTRSCWFIAKRVCGRVTVWCLRDSRCKEQPRESVAGVSNSAASFLMQRDSRRYASATIRRYVENVARQCSSPDTASIVRTSGTGFGV